MKFKKYIACLMVFMAMFIFIDNADAQRRGTKKRTSKKETEEKTSNTRDTKLSSDFRQKMIGEIGFGNPTFFGGGGASQFNIALKPGIGYKFVDRVAAGVFIKGDYTFANLGGQEFSLFDYGAGLFAKFLVIDAIYLRAEGVYQNYSYDRRTGVVLRDDFIEPMLGLGYRSGFGTWKFGGEILFHMDRDVRDYAGQIYEFWLKLDYNF